MTPSRFLAGALMWEDGGSVVPKVPMGTSRRDVQEIAGVMNLELRNELFPPSLPLSLKSVKTYPQVRIKK